LSAIADLPDLNVWLALASSDHKHHSRALQYWEEQASQRVLFCTVTALGLVRLVMQPKLMGDAVLRSAEKPPHCWRLFCSSRVSVMRNHPAMAGMFFIC